MSTDALDPIVRRLRVLVQDSPDLKDAALLYGTILPLLLDTDLHMVPLSITPDQVRAKIEMGLPLLHDLDLELDLRAVYELMLKLAHAIETIGENNQFLKRRLPGARTSQKSNAAAADNTLWRAVAARQIRLALEEDKLDISALLQHIATGKSGPVTALAQGLQLDPHLLWTLAKNAIKPALHAWCRQLTPLAEGIQWHYGYCFICGAGATLGELQGNNQVRHLRCGQCGADWPSRRLQCIYCGNEDHSTLSYLYTETRQEKMRVEVCSKCNGYLKIIAAFAPTPPELLPVEDLATLHLDYIAQERGHMRAAAQKATAGRQTP